MRQCIKKDNQTIRNLCNNIVPIRVDRTKPCMPTRNNTTQCTLVLNTSLNSSSIQFVVVIREATTCTTQCTHSPTTCQPATKLPTGSQRMPRSLVRLHLELPSASLPQLPPQPKLELLWRVSQLPRQEALLSENSKFWNDFLDTRFDAIHLRKKDQSSNFNFKRRIK